jgi:hypothetical protein
MSDEQNDCARQMLKKAFDLVCAAHERIPEDYQISIILTKDAASIEVNDSEGDDLYFETQRDVSALESAVDAAVEHDKELRMYD